MAVRLGNVLYRTACIFAVLWVAFIFLITATLPLPDLDNRDTRRGRWRCGHLEHRSRGALLSTAAIKAHAHQTSTQFSRHPCAHAGYAILGTGVGWSAFGEIAPRVKQTSTNNR